MFQSDGSNRVQSEPRTSFQPSSQIEALDWISRSPSTRLEVVYEGSLRPQRTKGLTEGRINLCSHLNYIIGTGVGFLAYKSAPGCTVCLIEMWHQLLRGERKTICQAHLILRCRTTQCLEERREHTVCVRVPVWVQSDISPHAIREFHIVRRLEDGRRRDDGRKPVHLTCGNIAGGLAVPGGEDEALGAVLAEFLEFIVLEDAEGLRGIVGAEQVGGIEDVAEVVAGEAIGAGVPGV